MTGDEFFELVGIDKETPGEIKAALYMIEYSDDPRRAAADLTAAN